MTTASSHPILALWAHPRSRSTAFERVFIERGDFQILHEPFSKLYYLHEQKGTAAIENANSIDASDYPSIKLQILQAAEKGPVFLKDMAYHCATHLPNDSPFLHRITHTFLIREPAAAIASHFALNPDVTPEEIGYARQWELFEKIKKITGKTPAVVDADDLLADPEAIMRAYCRAAGIEFKPEAMQWEKGKRREWKSWSTWHRDAAQSEGLRKTQPKYTHTVENNPRLSEYYRQASPFYQKMHARRLSPAEN